MSPQTFSTPIIPSFVYDFDGISISATKNQKAARWINAFSKEYLGKSTKNLFPTETLYGDWNGEILILAQDALPASALRELISTHIKNGDPKENAWRHANRELHQDKKGWRTNESLCILVKKYADGFGALYGSAATHLLYDDGGSKYRQTLRGFKDAKLQNHLVAVLNWVISNMPNIKCIVCLGEKSWYLVNNAFNTNFVNDFQAIRKSEKHVVAVIADKEINIIPTYHPAARGSAQDREKNWSTLTELLNKKTCDK